MMMYSVVARKKINIPDSQIKKIKHKGRNFLVGTYDYKGKEYKAWQVTK